MGTPCRIIVHCVDGKWRSIRYRYDGQLYFTGRMLHQYYGSQEAAEALVFSGDIVDLERTIEESTFFHRDYGRPLMTFERNNLDDVWGDDPDPAAFTYVWMDGAWHGCESAEDEKLRRLDDDYIRRICIEEFGSDTDAGG